LSFSRRRESRNVLLKKLDARLRGHDAKNSPTAQLTMKKNWNCPYPASKRDYKPYDKAGSSMALPFPSAPICKYRQQLKSSEKPSS
jgi:hypothetical protein